MSRTYSGVQGCHFLNRCVQCLLKFLEQMQIEPLYCSWTFFADPRESETLIPVDMHQAMEVHLGLSKGPVSRAFL